MNDITYISNYLNKFEADLLFDHLMNENAVNWQIPVRNDGKAAKSRRKMAYMSVDGADYQYADMNLKGMKFTSLVNFFRHMINLRYGFGCNSVLLNLYEDGKSEIRWHSDKEPQLGPNPIIPTLNLGASRKFHFLNKESGEKTHYTLSHGDLLIMGETCQERYLHAILKELEIKEPRISLTFRRVNPL